MNAKIGYFSVNNILRRSSLSYFSTNVGFPLAGQQMLFFGVARFTAGYEVSFGAFAAPGDGNDMIHGEFFGRNGIFAVKTASFGAFPFPPLGISEIPGFAAFFFYVRFRKVVGKGFHNQSKGFGDIWFTQLSISACNIR